MILLQVYNKNSYQEKVGFFGCSCFSSAGFCSDLSVSVTVVGLMPAASQFPSATVTHKLSSTTEPFGVNDNCLTFLLNLFRFDTPILFLETVCFLLPLLTVTSVFASFGLLVLGESS